MVIFDRPVFYLFGLSVINLAVQFSIYSAVWIRPTVQVRLKLIGKQEIFVFPKKVIWRRKLISNPVFYYLGYFKKLGYFGTVLGVFLAKLLATFSQKS